MLDQEAVLPRLRRAFWIGAFAVAGVGLTVGILGWLNQRGLALVLDAQQIGRLAREARNLAVEREAAIRGYLVSRQQVSLAPEFAARPQLEAKLDSLILLSSRNASQQDRAKAIASAIERWDRGFARPALDAAAAGFAFSDRETLAGTELFDSIRSAFDSFTAGQQRIYRTRVSMLAGLQRTTWALIIIEIALLLTVLYWLSRRALDQAKILFEQQEQLQSQSLDLQQQTAILEEQAVELEEQTDEATRAASALSETNKSLEETIRKLKSAEVTASLTRSRTEELEALLDGVIRNSPVGICLYDEARHIVRVNPAMEAITGLSLGEHMGKTMSEVTGEELSDAVDLIIDRVLATREAMINVPLSGPGRLNPTRERHFVCSFFPVTLPGNQPGVGAVVLETTQFKQLEEQLIQSQKMEAVGRLAGGVAHDFNNMLTAILSYGDLLLGDMPADSQQRADMTEIIKAAQKATALTRKLLAFSRQQLLRPTLVDLNATIDGLQNMLKRLLGKNIQLSLRLGPKLWTVSADSTELERVLMNLVLNSRDAMTDGGKLIIETSNVTIDEEYAKQHADTTPGPYVMVAVTDTGSGMSRDVRDKLFEPFFTTKEKGRGTGLGLPSVYGIVKQSGGFVWVYSEVGQGTTFKIYLPRAKGAESKMQSTPTRNRQVGSETILLVEDDAEVRSVATRILRRNGYRVLEAENGAEALRVCENESEPVDLIVTDIVMPEMGGTELAKRVRETQPDARILFTSGYTEDAVIRQSLLHAGEDFIEKPFTPATLAKKAREILTTQDGEES